MKPGRMGVYILFEAVPKRRCSRTALAFPKVLARTCREMLQMGFGVLPSKFYRATLAFFFVTFLAECGFDLVFGIKHMSIIYMELVFMGLCFGQIRFGPALA